MAPKFQTTLQYLSFATLGSILRWKIAELLTFEVDVKKCVIYVAKGFEWTICVI